MGCYFFCVVLPKSVLALNSTARTSAPRGTCTQAVSVDKEIVFDVVEAAQWIRNRVGYLRETQDEDPRFLVVRPKSVLGRTINIFAASTSARRSSYKQTTGFCSMLLRECAEGGELGPISRRWQELRSGCRDCDAGDGV